MAISIETSTNAIPINIGHYVIRLESGYNHGPDRDDYKLDLNSKPADNRDPEGIRRWNKAVVEVTR